MDDETLSKLHETQFSILCDLDEYCRNYDIKYSLYAGTMLGAVRHSGFIPWDDDVDVAMTREEYTKFCECVEKHPISNCCFVNFENDAFSMVCHGKLGRTNTIYLQEGDIEGEGHHEIWVDIFPIDKLSVNKKQAVETKRLGRKLIFLTRGNGRRTNDSFIKRMMRSVIRAIPGRECKINKIASRLKELDEQIDDYSWVSMSTLNNIDSMRFPKNMLEAYTEIVFNGRRFMSFADYDGMLKIIYGNYMELPPIAERYCKHNPELIRFE